MKPPRHIERDGYHALDWQGKPGFFIDDLWRQFPELVLGRYLVNTSYDSGFLMLSDSELKDGWRTIGRLAHSPRIRGVDQIPHDQYDEWLVFEDSIQVEEFETMVNYCFFTPVDLDSEGVERFWEQVVQLRPLHVIAENDGVYLVSRDENLIRKIVNAEPGASPNGGPAAPVANLGISGVPPSVT